MCKSIQDKLFFFIVAFTIFNTIPQKIRLNFLSGPLASELSFYPLFIGLLYLGYCRIHQSDKIYNWKKFYRFIILYASVLFVSLIVGLIQYPYYGDILGGPADQIEKFPAVMHWMREVGLPFKENFILILWMIFRAFKSLFWEILYTFGGAYLIYCWYYHNAYHGVRILVFGILFAMIPIILYGGIEALYLMNVPVAEDILKMINPYIHVINNNGTWWPPLLWKGQMRNVFAEPSYLGIWAAFAIPWIWFQYLKSKEVFKQFLFGMLVFLLLIFTFLSQARTATMLLIGESGIFLLCLLSNWHKVCMKKVFILCLLGVVAFLGSSWMISNQISPKSIQNNKDLSVSESVESYVNRNITSVASTTQRSNGARYSVMIADFKIGVEHPVLGVGSGLRNAYIPSHLPELSKNNKEINRWLAEQKEKGILKSGFPRLGEYTARFAENGIIGLLVFIFPAIFLFYGLWRKMRSGIDFENEKLLYICFLTSFAGVTAAGIGDHINITYCYWILLGLGYALCFGNEKGKNLHE